MGKHASPLTVSTSEAPPLVLDLDDTLLKTDVLAETALAYLKANIWGVFHIIAWLFRGRSYLKRRLAEAVDLDVDLLPVNADLMTLVQAEIASGREVVLATSANRRIAEQVAARFGIPEVLASDGVSNLKGAAKAKALKQRFPRGFAYAGDAWADLPVWKAAAGAILVGGSSMLARQIRRTSRLDHRLPRASLWRAAFKAARPHQWAKNALVFAPLILSGQFREPAAVATTLLAFVALCLTASGNYLLNDLWDLQEDRRHWSKRARPLASGDLPIIAGLVISPVAILAGFLLATLASPAVFAMLAIYLATSLAYSFGLKRAPLLDSFTLAALFTIRLGMGTLAAQCTPSAWLYMESMFLFSSLSFAKRYTELLRIIEREKTQIDGRGYRAADAPLVLGFGVASALGATLIMILYIINDAFTQAFYGRAIWLWGFPAAIYLFLSRIWLVCHRGELDDDPVAFAIRDKACLTILAVAALAFAFAWLA